MTLTDAEIDRLAAAARAKYPVPIALLDGIICDVIERGIDMSKPERANSLWDYEICFSVGHQTILHDAPACLVTSDEQILRAARRTKSKNVMSLEVYEELSHLPYTDFRERLTVGPPAC